MVYNLMFKCYAKNTYNIKFGPHMLKVSQLNTNHFKQKPAQMKTTIYLKLQEIKYSQCFNLSRLLRCHASKTFTAVL